MCDTIVDGHYTAKVQGCHISWGGGIFTREGLFHGGQNICDTLGDEVTDKQMDIAIVSSPLWPCGTVLIK